MKLVIQRVAQAKVSAQNHQEEIQKGLFILLGIGANDIKGTMAKCAEKVFKMRLMADKDGKMNLTVNNVNGEFLVVSQFTLYADTSGGNRPSFIDAAPPEQAKELYLHFVDSLKSLGATVKTGSFGNFMKINAELDGPVTIIVESPEK